MREKNQARTHKLVVTAMLAAVAAVLMFFEFSVPIMPGFIKLDISELPALLAAFSMGPVSGAAVCPAGASDPAAAAARGRLSRPLRRRASAMIHWSWPLIERNSSSAHASRASIVAASTRRTKLRGLVSLAIRYQW